MGRPSPLVLLESTDPNSYSSLQVLSAKSIWAVYYKGEPINVKSFNSLFNGSIKYHKVSFSNQGHAINLAKKLNDKFNCTDFTVRTFK